MEETLRRLDNERRAALVDDLEANFFKLESEKNELLDEIAVMSKHIVGSQKLCQNLTLQKQQLEVFFQRNPYPDPRETEEMSAQLGLGEAVIKVWFQNKRSRDKQRKFSHANRAAMRAALSVNPQSKENVSVQFGVSSSPILSNIQMLTSRICQYQSAMTAWNNQRHFC